MKILEDISSNNFENLKFYKKFRRFEEIRMKNFLGKIYKKKFEKLRRKLS